VNISYFLMQIQYFTGIYCLIPPIAFSPRNNIQQILL